MSQRGGGRTLSRTHSLGDGAGTASAKASSGTDSKMTNPIPTHRPVDVEEERFWLILHEPRCVPERKGPWPASMTRDVLREFIAARPTAYIDVLTVDHGEPLVRHGPEVLQVLDGRSMSVGRSHNARTATAHAEEHEALSTIRGLEEEVRAAQSQPIVSSNGHPEAETSAAREPCDRVEIVIARVLGVEYSSYGEGRLPPRWPAVLTETQVASLRANMRLALDTEVEAGGPYLNNGWNRPASPASYHEPMDPPPADRSAADNCAGEASQSALSAPDEILPPPTKSDEPHSGGGEP